MKKSKERRMTLKEFQRRKRDAQKELDRQLKVLSRSGEIEKTDSSPTPSTESGLPYTPHDRSQHIPEEELRRYTDYRLRKQMPAGLPDAINRHIQQCEECRSIVQNEMDRLDPDRRYTPKAARWWIPTSSGGKIPTRSNKF